MTARECEISMAGERFNIVLRLVRWADQEALREWKNNNRQYFFYQELIGTEQQMAWYRSYLLRDYDFMFVVQKAGQAIGCMGIRLLDEEWDVYNVVRGAVESAGDRAMSRAFCMMLTFVAQVRQREIGLKVLRQNPAISWYEKNGFSITGGGQGYYVMRHDPTKVERVELCVRG